MPLPGFCKLVFLIFPPLHSAPNPPMSQCFSFPLCSFGSFPSLRFIPTLPLPPFLSLLLHVSLVYLCSPLIRLRQAQFFWPLVPCLQPFHRNEQIWWSILSLFCSTLTHSHTPQTATEWRNRLSLAVCQPITTPHHQLCHLSPPPTCASIYSRPLPSSITFQTSEESAFITFNYPLCQRSPSYRACALDCLTPPPIPSILQ